MAESENCSTFYRKEDALGNVSSTLHCANDVKDGHEKDDLVEITVLPHVEFMHVVKDTIAALITVRVVFLI